MHGINCYGEQALPQSKGIKNVQIVILTAIGVGGATVFGAAIGFLLGRVAERFCDAVLGFAGGVMLAAAFVGLVLPSIERGGEFAMPICALGVFTGAFGIALLDKFTERIEGLAGNKDREAPSSLKIRKVMLFVFAIAIHNLPEGIAAGVGFGTGEVGSALLIAGAIALQNIPEGMVIISPMLSIGISKGKTFFYAVLTGVIEVVGTVVGYFAARISSAMLPFLLAFAGGTMLYVVCDEMIPEIRAQKEGHVSTYALLLGIMLMLILGELLS